MNESEKELLAPIAANQERIIALLEKNQKLEEDERFREKRERRERERREGRERERKRRLGL